jgi:SPP1 family predicted phage head-tail adaptor
MSIAAAFMTKDATIQRLVQTEISGELVDTYINKYSIKCAARPMSAVEQQGVSKTVGECDFRFYTMPIDARATDRVKYNGRIFEIIGAPLDVMMMGDHIMINTKEII